MYVIQTFFYAWVACGSRSSYNIFDALINWWNIILAYGIERLFCQLTIALETFRTKSTNRTYHLLPYNLYTPKKRSLDFERWSIASSCDILLVYNEGLGCRRGDLSLLTFSGESITGQSKNNGLINEPLAGKFAIFWRRNMTFAAYAIFSSPLNLVCLQIPVGQRSWVLVSPSTYHLKIQYGGNNWRFSETLGRNSRTAAKSTRSSHWNNGAKTSGLWTTNVASALFGIFPTQRRVSCLRRGLICLRFSVSTVKTRVEEPSLRTCWQEFAILLNTPKYKNLFSQERLNRFLCVAYNIIWYDNILT